MSSATPPFDSSVSDLNVRNFAVCEVQAGMRLIGAAVDAITAYLVLAGDMHMRLPGLASLTAPQGSLVLLPAGLQPSIASDSRPAIEVGATRNCLASHEGLLVFDAAHGRAGDLRVLVGRVVMGDGDARALIGAVGKPVVGDLRCFKVARDAYALILAELERPKLGSSAMAAAMMKTCLVLFARRYRDTLSTAAALSQQTPGTRLTALAGVIRARPSEIYSVENLASLAGMSRSTFARQFTEALGASPMEYVLRARLQHAASLLGNTTLSIKQIAAASGFASRSHFSRAFRLLYGIDPSGYRGERPLRAGEAPKIT